MHCIFIQIHARIQRILSEGSNFDNVFFFFFFFFFLFDDGRKDPNTTISEMAFRWRADDGPTLNAGLVAL